MLPLKLSRVKPLRSTPMMSVPINVSVMLPMPPMIEVPPRTTAVITWRFRSFPMLVVAAESLPR